MLTPLKKVRNGMQTVMIVEEDVTIRQAFVEMLEDEGHTCEGVASFEQVSKDMRPSLVVFSTDGLNDYLDMRAVRPHLKGLVLGPASAQEIPTGVSRDLRGELRIDDLLSAVEELTPRPARGAKFLARFVRGLSLALRFRFA